MLFAFTLALIPALTGAIPVDESTTPVLMWSGKRCGSCKRAFAPRTALLTALAHLGSGLLEGHRTMAEPQFTSDVAALAGRMARTSGGARAPVLVSVTLEKATNQYISKLLGAFDTKQASVVEGVVRGSAGSLALPRVAFSQGFQSFGALMLSGVSNDAKISLRTDTSSDSCSNLLSNLKKQFSDRVSAMSVVFTRSAKVDNEMCLQRLNSEVSDLTGGNFVMLFAADETPRVQLSFPDAALDARRREASAAFRFNSISLQSLSSTTTTSNSTLPGTGLIQYVTPVQVIGAVFSLMLLGFVLIGSMAMLSINVPMRFQKEFFKIGKIY